MAHAQDSTIAGGRTDGMQPQAYRSDLDAFVMSFGLDQAPNTEEHVIGGLETGAQCGAGENKSFARRHAAPDGHRFIRAGVSNQYEGTATATIESNGDVVNVISNCTGGELAKYRWWGVYVAK